MKKVNKFLIFSFIITCILFIKSSALAINKTETVYTILNSDGTLSKTIVTNKLTYNGKSTIEDETTLKEILNINGNETYERNNNKISWNTLNKDIIYQGKTDKKLPIDIKIKYYLNEKEINPSDLINKSGKIKIKYSFINNEKEKIKVNGKYETMYTPFVITLGSIIKTEDNSNVEISNGKVVNTGNRNILIGVASPGLYESMKINEFKGLNEITVTFKTKKYKPSTTYIVSTPKLLESADLDIFNKVDTLSSNMALLQSNMDKLQKGTLELKNGIDTFYKGTEQLKNGINTIKLNMTKIENGSISIDEGIKQILSTIKLQQKSLTSTDIESSLQSLNTLKSKNSSTIELLIRKTGLSKEKLFEMYNQYNLSSYTGNDENLISIKQTCELISLLDANNTAINANINNIKQTSKNINELFTKLTIALEKTQTGTSNLSNGIKEINLGLYKIYNGSVDINNGAKVLSKGADTLNNGTQKFNKNGIKKLSNYAYSIKKYKNKTQALINLSKNYKGFASNNSENINFIFTVK